MLLVFIVSAFMLIVIVNIISLSWKRRKLPPGPLRWPIIGNLYELTIADAKYPHIALAKMSEKYGDIMSFGYGVHDAVVISSHKAMKDLFKREDLCTNRFEFPYVLDRAYQKNLGVQFAYAKVWREMRRFTFKSLKGFGVGSKSMEQTFRQEMDEMVVFIKATAENNNGILTLGPQSLASNAINMLWSFVSGSRFPTGDEKLERMLKYNELALEVYGYSNIYNAIPFLKDWFPKLCNHAQHMRLHIDAQDFFDEIIEERQQRRVGHDPDNFVDVFLEEIEKNAGNPDTMFTKEQLNILLSDLFLAGSETNSTVARWAILFLTMNPEVQQRVQAEIANVLGDGPISLSDAPRLPYLKATIYEVLRMGNIIPMPLPRKAMKDIYYNNYKIPKGSAVFMNLYSLLNDKHEWKDPHSFHPERFMDTSGVEFVNQETFNVFGFGKRMCPAENFSMDSMFLFFVTLFRTFSFEVPAGEKLSIDNPNPGLAIGPKTFSVKVNLH